MHASRIFAFVVGVALAAAPVSAGRAAANTWSGTWSTSWSGSTSGTTTMTLTQSGASVTGTYDYHGGKIAGTLSGNVLKGSWTETSSAGQPIEGGFQFALS